MEPKRLLSNFIPLIFFSLIQFQTTAQEYIPFLQADKVWQVIDVAVNLYPDVEYTESLMMIQDSSEIVVNSDTILAYRFDGTANYYWENHIEKRVYITNIDSNTTKMLYDFSLNQGDTVQANWFYLVAHFDTNTNATSSNLLYVSDKYTEIYGGKERAVLEFESVYSAAHTWCDLKWIEGIGSNAGPTTIRPADCWHLNTSLACYRDSNSFSPIYGNDCTLLSADQPSTFEDITLYPNPSNGLFTVQTEKQIISLRVFSSTGSLILNQKVGLGFSTELDISSFTDGLYTLEVQFEKEIVRKKIIKG